MRSSAARRSCIASALAVAGALALGSWAAPALAVRGHEFDGAFGWGTVDGEAELQRCQSAGLPAEPPACQTGLSGNGPGQFDDPRGIAVNEASGQVYVVDKANDRVEIFNAAGSEFEGEFNGSGLLPGEGKAAGSGGGEEEVPSGQFDEPEEIAVDNSCAQRHLGEPACKEEDPSNGDVYVVDTQGHAATTASPPVIDKFGPAGEYLGQITRNPAPPPVEFPELGFRALYGVAVDRRGEVWVEEHNFGTLLNGAARYTNAADNEWIDFRSTEDPASSHPGPGLGVDGEGNLYVHNTFPIDRLAEFSKEGQLLSGELDEEVPTDVAVEAESGNVYAAHQGNVHRLDASAVSPAHPGAVSLEVLKDEEAPSFSGVAVNARTLTVYAADTAANRVDVFTPEAPGRPTITPASESVSDVSAGSASFAAEVNPRSEVGEEATSYAFRYGPCEAAASCPGSPYPQSTPAPEGSLTANYEPDPLSAHPQDLVAHTVYHMRLFAHNSHGQAEGEEVIFTTQGSQAPGLPDHRRYELVSPAQKHGALIFPRGPETAQAAAGGDAISYLATSPSEAQPPGYPGIMQILSGRGASSWRSLDIALPHEAPAGASIAGLGEYPFFSADLTHALVQPSGPFAKATSPQASEQTIYLRSDFPAGEPSGLCAAACYRPLVSGCPGGGEPCPAAVEEVADVPEGTKFGIEPGAPSFLGASADASHVVLGAQAPLTEGAPEESLYEWSGGRLALVSVLPGGKAAAATSVPALGYLGKTGTVRIARHAVSEDGRRVVFTASALNGKGEPTEEHHLYLRDSSREETIELDAPQAGCTSACEGSSQPVFQTASADDSRVFFTDSRPLTAGAGGSDLYECRIEEGEEGPSCALSDLAAEGEVLGLVAGASEDGATVYFTANAKLSSQPGPGGEEAVAGDCGGKTAVGTPESETAPQRCDLYVRSAGQTRLVAVLSGADFPDWSLHEGLRGGLGALSDRVSPDGRYLAFSSRLSLSGYDNRDAASGKPDQEVFLYDSAANTLVCASCDPSGGRPRGVQYRQIETGEGGLAGGARVWPRDAWIAASTPAWSTISAGQGFALYQSRYLSDSGRLFFNSADALVPRDANRTEDVYEYEPPGIGDCSEEGASFAPSAHGCLALISSGTAKEESAFLDASESGDDVFLLTAQRLLPSQDLDSSLDLYDAHVCSEASPCLPEPPQPLPACEGDACQSPGAPPESPTPGSLSFQGPGNPLPAIAKPKPKTPAQLRAEKLKKALGACRRRKKGAGAKARRRRAACERQARKRYGPRKAKKSRKAGKARRRGKGKRR